jgi:hypothetical protein
MTARHWETVFTTGLGLRTKREGEKTVTYFEWWQHRVPGLLGAATLNVVVTVFAIGLGGIFGNPVVGLVIGVTICIVWTSLGVQKVKEITRHL